ncbi:MAG TPA: ion channel [Methylophilaceae bacterium]|nr:ion channel [Methylophilaceae bacterium]
MKTTEQIRLEGTEKDNSTCRHVTCPPRLAQVLENRCFLLLLALIVLLVATPFLAGSVGGKKIIGLLNVIILVTAVVAVERSRLSFAIATFLGLPTLAFQILALQSGLQGHFALCWGFAAAIYAFTIASLLHYVLRRDIMTADKLYGAAAAYIMIAILWAFLYGVLQYFYPGAYTYQGVPKVLDMTSELIFFSFTVLTTAGFGDITPMAIFSRYLTILEAVTGVMYVGNPPIFNWGQK